MLTQQQQITNENRTDLENFFVEVLLHESTFAANNGATKKYSKGGVSQMGEG